MATEPSAGTAVDNKKKIKDSKNCGLKKCFSALVDRKQVNLELEVLRLMLRKELQVNLDALEPELANIMPYLLVYYIKNWPGWQKSVEYYSGNIQFKAWYEKFYKFITLKLNEVMKTHYRDALGEIQKEKSMETRKMYMLKKIADRNTQTDNLAPKVIAPFTIHIIAKPVLLNTIVFTDSNDGDLILKQHSVLEWDETVSQIITLKQIISWPHVGVHMYSPVFSFSRRNLHEFRRHVSLVGTPLPSTVVGFIEEIKVIDPKSTRKCYTLDYMKEMAKEFLRVVEIVYPGPAVLEAFQTVVDEFLADIEELQILRGKKPTIATNTSVLFNIGNNTYFRNKKLSKGPPSRNDIGYTEVIIPKMETALAFLADDEKIQSYLKLLQSTHNDPNNKGQNLSMYPQITFSCSYCQKNYENCGLLATHLKEEHKMEQPMLCAQCKKPFPAFDLSQVRWGHTCSSQAKSKAKPSG